MKTYFENDLDKQEMLKEFVDYYKKVAPEECNRCIPDSSGRDRCSGMRECEHENARCFIERITKESIEEVLRA